MRRILFVTAFLLATCGFIRAQDFNYTVSTDTVAWNELNSQTILNSNNSAWNFSYKIPIGFSFPFLGRTFDSLTVETNGYLVFDSDRNYAITAFSGVGDHIDSAGNHAIIGYELSGTSGNHILKIQYLNCSPYSNGTDVQSWQVWLRENGNVEVRIGPGTLRWYSYETLDYDTLTESYQLSTVVEVDSLESYRLGLLNMNMNSEVRGIFISGSPDQVMLVEVNENNQEIPRLTCVPEYGYRYTFTYSN